MAAALLTSRAVLICFSAYRPISYRGPTTTTYSQSQLHTRAPYQLRPLLHTSLLQNREFSTSLTLNTVKTTFPNLPYNPPGFTWSEDIHSSAGAEHRVYPQTDLAYLTPWVTFESEIHNAITTRMAAMDIVPDTGYDISPGFRPKQRIVVNEEGVRMEATIQLHDLVETVLGILGINGRFFPSSSGNTQIIGEPDFSWLRNLTRHPKVVLEYKTKWAALLKDLPGYFQRNDPSNVSERQAIHALQQLYGYMSFNENKYGILSNMQHAWFFQRIETDNLEGKSLQYYGPIETDIDSDSAASPGPSLLKAFVGLILLAETESTRFHSSDEGPPGPYFGASMTAIRNRDLAIAKAQFYHSIPMAGSYPVLPLDPRLCRFKRSSVLPSPQQGCTLRASLARSDGGNLNVFCKIVDLFRSSDTISALDTEVCRYAALLNLQGVVIPRVYGYYDVWGLLKLLALEDVGTAITQDEPIDTKMRIQMKFALACIHSAGYVHGDIARRNFCKRADRIFIVDWETLTGGDTVEMEKELAAIDVL